MAVVNPTQYQLNPTNPPELARFYHEWVLASGDTGEWVDCGHFPDRCIEVANFNGSTTVTIEGSNSPTLPAAAGIVLKDTSGAALSFGANDIRQIMQSARWLRPVATGGSATGVIIRMVSKA